ncbi:MAG TPA: methyl-accepting chemotaxis protein [Prolixibacteraceae bacterium]|nr:methyl-accepting chemotaxis protein [Prolixibacteraceae bacterium]
MKFTTRFILLLIVLITTFSSIAVFTTFSFSKIKKFSEIDKMVYKLYNHSLDMKKDEGDYFNWDLKNPNYFETGESEQFNLFKKNYQLSDEICSQLISSGFINRNNFKGNIEEIKQLLAKYYNLFSIIEKNKLEIGFEEWGLVGVMNTSAANIEKEIQKQNNPYLKIKLFSLRQQEKDYLFRRDFKYKEQFDRELYAFFKELESQPGGHSSNVYRLLKIYGTNFNSMIEKDFYIGNSKSEGLIVSLEQNSEELNKAITLLSENIPQKTKGYISQTIYILLIFITVCTAVALLIGLLIIRSTLNLMGGEPEEVALIANSISRGNLQLKFDETKDYEGVMKSMVTMTRKIAAIIQNIHKSSEQVSIASQHFTTTSQNISQGASEQSSSIDEIVDTVASISESISQNAANALETEKITRTVKNRISEIKDQSDLSLETNKIISQKIEMINGIAAQTKILALNAAVEAARAGVHGRGFNVVAEEVKRLADDSSTAAKEIIKLTNSSLVESENVSKLIDEIIAPINKSTLLVQQISDASQEQRSGAQQINQTIQGLYQLSQENAVASEEMATNTVELEQQIYSLKQMVSYFNTGSDSAHSNTISIKAKKNKKKEKFTLPDLSQLGINPIVVSRK